jgi:hypothetical protein
MINATFDFLGLPVVVMIIAIQDEVTKEMFPAILIKTFGTLDSSTLIVMEPTG